jgi:hypothetical protein
MRIAKYEDYLNFNDFLTIRNLKLREVLMNFIKLCLLSLLVTLNLSAFAQELVYDYEQLDQIDKRLSSENIIYKRRFARDAVIKRSELGTPYSHFFRQNDVIQRLYQDFQKRCYRLMISDQFITAQAAKCDQAPKLKIAGHADFQEVQYPLPVELHTKSVLLREESYQASYKGFSFMHHLKDLYLPIQNPPLDDYHFKIQATSDVSIQEKSFKLKQTVSFLRSQFHFYTPRVSDVTQTIEFSKGDLLFTNFQGQFLLFKRYQPKPFNFKFLWVNPNHRTYLEGVSDLLYTYQQEKVCFMDNHFNHSPYDCEKIAIKNTSISTYNGFNLIFIDTLSAEIQIK